MGGGPSNDEELTILERRSRWRRGTRNIEYEAIDKYVKEVVKEMNLQDDSSSLDAPKEREIVENVGADGDADLLDVEEAKKGTVPRRPP